VATVRSSMILNFTNSSLIHENQIHEFSAGENLGGFKVSVESLFENHATNQLMVVMWVIKISVHNWTIPLVKIQAFKSMM